MINRAAMMAIITEVCPGFAGPYDAFLAEWHNEPELPYYLALADFSCHLIALLQTGERSQLDSAFEAIERLHTEGDQYVREAATIGILENLQNMNLHSSTKPDHFIEYLRPASLRYWHKVEDFWDDGKIITDD